MADKGGKIQYVFGARELERFRKRGSFSRNKNPMATRAIGDRQTYQNRNYDGVAGPFLPEQKILIRYSEADVFDNNFITNLEEEMLKIAQTSQKFNRETLEVGKKETESCLLMFTPIDTGKLVKGWKVFVNEEKGVVEVENEVEYASNQEYGMYGDQQPQSDGKTLWYPGYYMMTKSLHRAMVVMQAYARKKQFEMKGLITNG